MSLQVITYVLNGITVLASGVAVYYAAQTGKYARRAATARRGADRLRQLTYRGR